MTDRVTIKQLEALCDEINRLTGSPMQPYARGDSGSVGQVGCYCLDQAYGGVNLVRIANAGGGQSCPIGLGFRTKRELRDQMRAFIDGIRAAQTA